MQGVLSGFMEPEGWPQKVTDAQKDDRSRQLLRVMRLFAAKAATLGQGLGGERSDAKGRP